MVFGPILGGVLCLATLLAKFWQISMYVTDDAIAKKALCDVKLRKKRGKWSKFSHIELSNSVIS